MLTYISIYMYCYRQGDYTRCCRGPSWEDLEVIVGSNPTLPSVCTSTHGPAEGGGTGPGEESQCED